jgi:hypothetical protein
MIEKKVEVFERRMVRWLAKLIKKSIIEKAVWEREIGSGDFDDGRDFHKHGYAL